MANEIINTTLPCSLVNNLSSSLQCNFLIENECLEEEAMDYVYFVYCVMGSEWKYASTSLIILLIIVFFLTLSAIADCFLCPSLLTIAKNLKMSDSLAGVTFLAFGNGCSDIFTAFAGASSGRPDLIVSELLGAGIFCLSIVAGLVFIHKDFRLAYRPLLRDTIFYLVALYYTWYICWAEQITFFKSLGFILIYVVYLSVALGGQAVYSRLRGQYEPSEVEVNQKANGIQVLKIDPDDEGKSMKTRASNWFVNPRGSLRKKSKAGLEISALLESNKLPPSYGVNISNSACSTINVSHRKSFDSQISSKSKTSYCNREASRGYVNEAFSVYMENNLDRSQSEVYGDKINTTIEQQQHNNRPLNNELPQQLSVSQLKSSFPIDSKCQNVDRIKKDGCDFNSEKKMVEWSSIKTENLSYNEWDDLIAHIDPFDSDNWSQASLLRKLIIVLRAPLMFIAICTIPVVDLEKKNHNWCRLLKSFHCVSIPLMIVLSNKIVPFNTSEGLLGISYPILIIVPGVLMAIFILKTTQSRRAPRYHVLYAYIGFIMSILWVYMLVTEILGLLKTIGIILSMSDAAIGLSFLAWGNSLGDIVSNLTLAEAGHPRMALGASIGAPLLNLLIGFGVSFSIALSSGEVATIDYTPTLTLLCVTLAILITSLMLCTLVPPHYSRKPFGFVLISIYAIYFIVAMFIELKIVRLQQT